jgi:hypothetical protein
VAGQLDQEAFAPELSSAELEEAVFGRRPGTDRGAALGELLRRRPARTTDMLSTLLADPSVPAALRTTAAIGLGTSPGPGAAEAPTRALRAEEGDVVRRAADGLGLIGDEGALTALEDLPDVPGAAGRSVALARTLISYRLGLDRHRLDPPPRDAVLPVDPERSTPLPVTPLDPRDATEALAAMRAAVPTLDLAAASATELECGANRLCLVLTEDAAGPEGVRRLSTRATVAAVVFKHSSCPETWYVAELVLTHPDDDRTALVFGLRPTGALWHHGRVHLDEDEVRAEVLSLDTPYGPPVRVEAVYRAAEHELRLPRAVVGRRPSGPPRPQEPSPAAAAEAAPRSQS